MADDAVPTPSDSAGDRPPDWFIVFGDDLPPAPLSEADRARLARLSELSEELSAQLSVLRKLARRLQPLVDEALDAGLSVETVANHTTLRPGPLQAYRDGEQPFMPWV